ncbi:hypothetical protein IWW38_006461, partial [Coemansia aciculifera]
MEKSPGLGVDLVIGSVANFMWTSQMVYSRPASPFYDIRGMFSPISPGLLSAEIETAAALPPSSSVDDKAKQLSLSGKEPVFNAVVGGKVRSSAQASSKDSGSTVPVTTAERGSGQSSLSDGRTHHATAAVSRAVDTVQSPAACGRILLLLTALRYGRSLGNTPIYMWLTDSLDYAPMSVLQGYFDSLFSEHPPVFDKSLPVEPDWKQKVLAFVSLWTKD